MRFSQEQSRTTNLFWNQCPLLGKGCYAVSNECLALRYSPHFLWYCFKDREQMWEHFHIRQISVLQSPDEDISCPVRSGRIYSFLFCKLPLHLHTSSLTLLLVHYLLLYEMVTHCLCVDTAVVFDLFMLKLSTSCHLKIWLALTPDLPVCTDTHTEKTPSVWFKHN